MKTKYAVILTTPFIFPVIAFSLDGTSIDPNAYQEGAAPKFIMAESLNLAASVPITFSEFPLNTYITNQYANKGIIFGGDSPFITTDGANPTSPVLSGSPRFSGVIEGKFVDPKDGETPIIVQSVSLDAGYFDEMASTRIQWFDPKGNKLGQRTNSKYGIEKFILDTGNIASWRIEVIKNEPAGYAIDNVSFNNEILSSILFRELKDSEKDGSWGLVGDEIPGWDHSALHLNNLVYESHPQYEAGTYISEDGTESVSIQSINGVQAQHTRGTFKYDARIGQTSKVIDFEEIPISLNLANSMKIFIEEKIAQGAKFAYLDFSSSIKIQETMSPSVQKGANNTFTCVGLIEWAAEKSGYNNGQGFIRNALESFSYPVVEEGFPPTIRTYEAPLLSPSLLNWALKGSVKINEMKEWLQGFFDPVDFIITDSLNRRLGFSDNAGQINEIPGALFSGGKGKYEQFLIPNPVPGRYKVELFGLNAIASGAIGSSNKSVGINEYLAEGAKKVLYMIVDVVPGGMGDLDSDGDVDSIDKDILTSLIGTYVNDPNHPGDIDGDGEITNNDVQLIQEIVDNLNENQPPVAQCQGITVSANESCQANANVDNGSYDPDGDPITITKSPLGPYVLGGTGVTLTVTDSNGNSASCSATVTVVDTTSPTITSVTVSPNTLWPPNHKMVPVQVTAATLDNCSAAPVCTITSVTSNEPDNGLGDGDTANDIVVTGDLTVNLRAERSGTGTGRVYTVNGQCADTAGNSAPWNTAVTVPHDKGK